MVPSPFYGGNIQTLVRTNGLHTRQYLQCPTLYPFPMRRFTGANDIIIFKNENAVSCTPLFYTDASAEPQASLLVIEG